MEYCFAADLGQPDIAGDEALRGWIKKPAKKLFGVLCGFLARPKKDSLQLSLIPLYTILR